MNHLHGLTGGGSNPKNQLGVNLLQSAFLFLTLTRDDEESRAAIRTTGVTIGRGFLNDFDASGPHATKTLETIQFLRCSRPTQSSDGIGSAELVALISAKYRARLDEVEHEFRRRLEDVARFRVLHGALQVPRYTSAEMYEHAYRHAVPRQPGPAMPNAIIFPLNKSAEWWHLSALERHQFFYPHADLKQGRLVKGHAIAAEEGVRTIFRQVYHNPEGYQREGEFDFITYFECGDQHLPVYERITAALRDERQNPEWRFVTEGPQWRGRRVMRW